ncbi:MAG: NAD-dependent epimerase/dehydratase family protein [Thalassolituus sp.]|uniref:NAD-dependent epimerase/dehydratase family protein n=1 Tax=Thalassolituus sp. TaxID=2030822 RepID=UPI003982433A
MPEVQAKTALIVGATGLVGSHLLSHLIESDRYQRIIVLARRVESIKVHEKVIAKTFAALDRPAIEHVDDFYCALGTTQKVSGKAGLQVIDHHLVVRCAEWARAAGANAAAVVSALGASVRSLFFYSRVKGEMEKDVEAIGFDSLMFWQPSVIYGARESSRPVEWLAARLLTVKCLGTYQSLPGEAVARAMAIQTPLAPNGIFRYNVGDINSFLN